MMSLRRYTADDAEAWDDFVEQSKNGTFLFKRQYMDYHSDRFTDHSLLFFDKKRHLIAILPANEVKKEDGTLWLYSHQGLTYGGFVLNTKATMTMVLELFQQTISYLKNKRFSTFYYKQIPTCYHLYPAEEDEYALWKMGAQLAVCNISSTISLNNNYYNVPLETRRRRGIKKAIKHEYNINETNNPDELWPIIESNLQERYNVKPVHTLSEMKLLMKCFPKEIKCFLARKNNKTEAGAIVYVMKNLVHIQYPHASHIGKQEGALDLVYDYIIKKYTKQGLQYIDIGISNEDYGQYLNENLIAQKEGFGARGIAYKQWKLNI